MVLQLPTHLQGRQNRNIAATSSAVIGPALPPHISIGSNTFTLVDAAGNEYHAGSVIEVVVADSSGNPPPKRYYKDKWTPNTGDPPLCWSADGITPSRSVATPQARTCAECPMNARGSKISELSGAAIKACRDEIWLAVLLPQYPTMLFQLVITPGSFKNWGLFTGYFKGGVDISDVITRIAFQSQVNGVLTFEISGFAQNNPQYITNDLLNVLEDAWAEKKTDALIGRAAENLLPAQIEHSVSPASSGQQSAPFVPATSVSPAPSGQVVQPPANTASPSRRRRNTAEAAPQAQPMQAPFMPQQPVSQAPNASAAAFGMAQGAAPDPTLQNTLDNLFGKK